MAARIRFACVALVTIVACLLVAEVGRRVLDGYQVWGIELTKDPAHVDMTWSDGGSTDALLRTIPVDIDADASWFGNRPAPLTGMSPEWAEQRRARVEPSANYIFNLPTIKEGGLQAFLEKHGNALDEVFTFRAPQGDTHPAYRFYPNIQSGFGFTNAFGWRSRPIDKRKPADVIRIVALGDSTTNVYPEMVEHWLNLWSTSRRLGVRFEMIHAARPGTNARDAAAILDYELRGFDPDYVLLYGYGNAIFNADALVKLPDGVRRGQPSTAPSTVGVVDRTIDRVNAGLQPLARHSAAAAFLRSRLAGQRGGALLAEPPKPATRIEFPPEIDEQDPDPDVLARHATGGLMGLDVYMQGLNRLGEVAKRRNIGVFASTFRVVAFDGMLLGKGDTNSGGLLYEAINETYWWPYTYTQIHRLMNFYNRAITKWAERNGQSVIDVNERMPWRPELYGDGMHELPAGEALHAWIVVQSLMPRIRADIAAGLRPGRSTADASELSDYWKIGRLSVSDATNREVVNALSRPPDPSFEVPAAFPIASIELAFDKAEIARAEIPIVTTAEDSSAYAAAIPFDANRSSQLQGRGWIAIRARVRDGRISVGVLDKAGARFVAQTSIEQSPDVQEVYLTVPDLAALGRVMISNNRPGAAGRSVVEVHGVRLMRFLP